MGVMLWCSGCCYYVSEYGKRERYQMTGRKLSLYHCIKVKAVGVSVVAIGGQAD